MLGFLVIQEVGDRNTENNDNEVQEVVRIAVFHKGNIGIPICNRGPTDPKSELRFAGPLDIYLLKSGNLLLCSASHEAFLFLRARIHRIKVMVYIINAANKKLNPTSIIGFTSS